MDCNLGLRHKDTWSIQEVSDLDDVEEYYWVAVSDRIRELAKDREGYPRRRDIDDLLLTGPAVTNTYFRAAVKVVLHDLVASEGVLVLSTDYHKAANRKESVWFFSFETARGAAEIAKRRQEGPYRCVWTHECQRRMDLMNIRQRPSLLLPQPEALKPAHQDTPNN